MIDELIKIVDSTNYVIAYFNEFISESGMIEVFESFTSSTVEVSA